MKIKPSRSLIKKLQDKKERQALGLFLVEGETTFLEFYTSAFELVAVFAVDQFIQNYQKEFSTKGIYCEAVGSADLKKLGTLSSNNGVVGIFKIKEVSPLVIDQEIVLALSDVNDPGNLGTLIRIADWYGISKIIASKNTVDVYNPKVVSATKGSLARVSVYYEDLGKFFKGNSEIAVIGADLQGTDVHTFKFPERGILLLGSESHGIADILDGYVTEKVTIPRYGRAESLNVGVAGAVILDNWKRK